MRLSEKCARFLTVPRNEPTEREAKGRMLNETQIDELIAHGIDYRGGVDRFGGNSAM